MVSVHKWEEAGEKLRQYRENYRDGRGKKLSIYKVAKRLNISGNYLSELERGLKCPSDVVLMNISEFYNVDKSELFAMYGKIVPEERSFILSNPEFRKTLTNLSIDERLTDEDKDYLSEELHKIYNELTVRKKKLN